MKSKCLSNLDKCKAICCKTIPMAIPEDFEKYRRLYELKGCKLGKVILDEEVLDVILLPARCKALTKDDKCSLWGTDNIPNVCKDGYTKIKGLPVPLKCVHNEKKM